jgi:hypothetical protein
VLALKVCSGWPLDEHVTFIHTQYLYTFFYQPSNQSPWPGNARVGSKKFIRGAVAVNAQRFKALGAYNVRWFNNKLDQGVTVDEAGWHFSPFPFQNVTRLLLKLKSWAHQEHFRTTEHFQSAKRWTTVLKEKCDHCTPTNSLSQYKRLPRFVRQNTELYQELLVSIDQLVDDTATSKRKQAIDDTTSERKQAIDDTAIDAKVEL